MSNSRLRIRLAATREQIRPAPRPTAITTLASFRKSVYRAALCAEREPDAELARSLTDRIGDHAIESHHTKQQSHPAKPPASQAAERCRYAACDRLMVSVIAASPMVPSAGFDFMNRWPQCRQKRFGGLRGPDDEREAGGGVLIERVVDGGPDFHVERTFSDVLDDADDLLDRIGRQAGVSDAPTDGILSRKVRSREGLIDDGYP